jgi:hypothetical protein
MTCTVAVRPLVIGCCGNSGKGIPFGLLAEDLHDTLVRDDKGYHTAA